MMGIMQRLGIGGPVVHNDIIGIVSDDPGPLPEWVATVTYNIPPPGGGAPTPYNGAPLPPPKVPPKAPSGPTGEGYDNVTKDSSTRTTPEGTENVEGKTTGTGVRQLWSPSTWPWWGYLLLAGGVIGLIALAMWMDKRAARGGG